MADADDLLQMFQSITTSDHDELVDQFAYLMQADPNTATFFLESCNWNVETAINHFLSTMERPAEPPVEHEMMPSHGNPNVRKDDAMMDEEGENMERMAQPKFDARFLTDLSFLQAQTFAPTSVVNMRWSFLNNGNLPWPDGTRLQFSQGEAFQVPPQIIVAPARPGERIDVDVQLVMPAQLGSFGGAWQLHAPDGAFGEPVWLVMNVVAGKPGTAPFVAPVATTANPTTAAVTNAPSNAEYDLDMSDL